MSLVLAVVSRENAFLMSDGMMLNHDRSAVLREDFSKIFVLQNGDRVTLTGRSQRHFERSLQSLPPSTPTRVVAKAIRDWAEAHPGEASIDLIGSNAGGLCFQSARFHRTFNDGVAGATLGLRE